MFCKNCGAEVKENSKFCTSCGAQLVSAEQSQVNTNSSVPKAENPVISDNQKNKINTSLIIKVAALIAIVCFILPFVTVSCSLDNQSEKSNKCTASGFDLAFGVDKKFDYKNPVDDSKSTEKQEVKINGYVLFAFVSTGACIAFAFMDKHKETAIISLVAIILLVIFKSTIGKYMRSLGMEAEAINYLVVDFKLGYYLCFLSHIAVLLTSAYSIFFESKTIKSTEL